MVKMARSITRPSPTSQEDVSFQVSTCISDASGYFGSRALQYFTVLCQVLTVNSALTRHTNHLRQNFVACSKSYVACRCSTLVAGSTFHVPPPRSLHCARVLRQEASLLQVKTIAANVSERGKGDTDRGGSCGPSILSSPKEVVTRGVN